MILHWLCEDMTNPGHFYGAVKFEEFNLNKWKAKSYPTRHDIIWYERVYFSTHILSDFFPFHLQGVRQKTYKFMYGFTVSYAIVGIQQKAKWVYCFTMYLSCFLFNGHRFILGTTQQNRSFVEPHLNGMKGKKRWLTCMLLRRARMGSRIQNNTDLSSHVWSESPYLGGTHK